MWSVAKQCARQFTILSLLIGAARAEQPGVSYVFPAGAQRGTTVDVRIGGFYLFDEAPIKFFDDQVTAPPSISRMPATLWFEGPRIAMPASQAKEDYPVDNSASFKVAEDATLGTHYWQVWTSQGIVPAQPFVVGDLPEIVEEEIDGEPVPVNVTLPLTINGRIFPREDVDLWRFQAKKGQDYTVEVLSARLGYPLDSRIEVLNSAGKTIAQNIDHFENDSFLRFRADADGAYTVRLHDSQFGGLQNYVYRLTITDRQVVDYVFPLGGQRGTTVDVALLGQALPERSHPIALSTDADTQQVVLPDGGRFTLEISDHPEYLESDFEVEIKPAISIPAVLNGQISEAGQRDEWAIQASQGQTVEFTLRASELGSQLDSFVELFDSDGKLLASNDDAAKGNTDSKFTYTFKADGIYLIAVSERFGSRGGENFSYRLTVNSPSREKRFTLSLPTSELTLAREQTAKLKVAAERFGGLDEEIQLEFQGLPDGVTVEGNTIAKGKTDADVTFKCDDKATIAIHGLRVLGTAVLNSEERDKAEAPEPKMVTATADWQGYEELKLAIAIATPFRLFGTFDTNYAHRGSTFSKRLFIERMGYDGPIEITMADRQIRHLQGVTGGKVIVPAGVKEYEYAIQLAPWMQPGRTARMVVCGSAIITDHDGTKHRVSHSSGAQNDQIICFVSPSLSSITSGIESMRFESGGHVEVPFTVNRGELSGDVKVEIVMPNHLKGVSAIPVSVSSKENNGVIQIRFADTGNIVVNAPVVLRATIRDEDGMHTAEDKIDLVR